MIFSVTESEIRLDHFLVRQEGMPTRSQIVRLIHEKNILVNEKATKPGYLLQTGDSVSVVFPLPQKTLLTPEEIPLDILYEDEDLLVLNKKAGQVVHPGAGHQTGTLTHALLAHCKGLSTIGGVERPGIVHRLDRGTSGVLVVAKNDKTHLHLSQQFQKHSIKKIYTAILWGSLGDKTGTISSSIGRHPVHRQKMAVLSKGGREAVTHFTNLAQRKSFTLLEIQLETGRTHQIRVHFSHRGFPLVGDEVYGGGKNRLTSVRDPFVKKILKNLDHPMLHAKILGFLHPRSGQWMEWVAPWPADFLHWFQDVFNIPPP